MDQRREAELEQAIADAQQTIADCHREIAFGHADNLWNAGDLTAALVIVADFGGVDIVDYCRKGGLTEEEAYDTIHAAGLT